ncbi:Imm50 family immunity protein [Streptomyces sp. NPDC002795]|uniref:Imm50 family immunity protein n=1 Tax=Streptomyces sp. NPDC002795 TaxID=3364665 RepID=UPI003682300F
MDPRTCKFDGSAKHEIDKSPELKSATTMTVPIIPIDPDPLRRLYGKRPRLDEFRLRSINIDLWGPSLKLRVDLAEFPEIPPEGWAATGYDVVQCHIRFSAVERLSLQEWTPPTRAHLSAASTDVPRMLDVSVRGAGVSLDFRCHESVGIGHISAFRVEPDGSDEVPHGFLGRVDTRLFATVPRPHEKIFYAR